MSERATSSPFYSAPQGIDSPAAARVRTFGACLLLATLISWLCTELVAVELGSLADLGTPLLALGRLKIYAPSDWLGWYGRWHRLDHPAVRHAFNLATALAWLGAAAVVALYQYRNRSFRQQLARQSENLHGSAHWASAAEVRGTGLLGSGSGVYVGGWKDPRTGQLRYLRHDGPEHIMAFAPTRSGKGVGLVLPTLLSWPHSAVIYDIKGENWALTAGWRQQGANNLVIKFDPTAADGSSARFNPLMEVRLGTHREVADTQNIITMVVDPEGKGLKDHWQKSAQALLVGVALHILYAETNKSLNGIISFLSDPARDVRNTMKRMLDTHHVETIPAPGAAPTTMCHPVVAAAARDMLNKADEELSSVLSTAIAFLTLYRDPVVAHNTSACDFRIAGLMNSDQPVSLYFVVPPSDKDRLRPLLRLILNQLVRGLTERMEFKDGRSVAAYKHRLLLMLDEFPSLGKLDIFEESLAFIAGYGLKAYLIIQDISQLHTAYGKDESIFSNCHVRVAYAPNKVETAELLSKMAGTTTIVKRSHSISGGTLGGKSSVSSSTQETQRPLLTADEAMRLPAARKDAAGNVLESGDMLIFTAGHAPIYGKQILYFLDPTFSARAQIPAPWRSDVIPSFAPPPWSQTLPEALSSGAPEEVSSAATQTETQTLTPTQTPNATPAPTPGFPSPSTVAASAPDPSEFELLGG